MIEESEQELKKIGWSIGDVSVHSQQGHAWIVVETKPEQIRRAERMSQREAWKNSAVSARNGVQ